MPLNANARRAALMAYGPIGLERLDKGLCPACGGELKDFRDDVSKREAGISGLCQACQDRAFTPDDAP